MGVKKNVVSDASIAKIREFLETIQYGSVTIIVQDGNVIQIEKNEKVRLK
ncbi:YezD family protein [Anaerosporobacter sp.]|nr:YezD family protein [Anaerosporobacter sp.]